MLWRHVYALETCVCSGDRVYAVCSWYMLLGHGICCMDMGDVFFWEKNIWIWKMISYWRRTYGYGRCLLVGEEYIFIFIRILIRVVVLVLFIIMIFLYFSCSCSILVLAT